MQAYFKKMFSYTDWANFIMLGALEQNQINNDYIIQVMSHIVNAQFIWLDRVIKQQHHFQIWGRLTFTEMRKALQENQALWLAYLNNTKPEQLSATISYTNQSGSSFESVVSDCMTQAINHSTYHRAQIAKALRDLGFTPPTTDFIIYCRMLENIH
jgi:uncharacterized damage-inducible protein DinB